MASLIDCPHCGLRPKEEFSILGDAASARPAADADAADWLDHLFLRDNPKGRLAEHWHHAGGCRRWLVVTRDTASHDVIRVMDVRDAREGLE